jgi:hypothetical protein
MREPSPRRRTTFPQTSASKRLLAEVERRQSDWRERTTITGKESVVPFVIAEPLPAVRVRINGTHDATFLIDTGAPGVVLDPQFAKDIGVDVSAAGTGVFAGGKTTQTEKATLSSISLGTATAYNVAATVVPTRGALDIPNVRLDGIVGTGVLERFLATIDYPKARLVLRPRSNAESERFQSAARAENATIVPCWLVGDHFVFARAQVNDAPPGIFLFDSGLAGGGLMPTEQLVTDARISVDRAHPVSGSGGGGSVTAFSFTASKISVDSATQHDVPGLYTAEGTPFGIFAFAVQGALSHDFLKHYAYTVDFDAMRIVLGG